MAEENPLPDSEELEFPIESRYHPANRMARGVYDLLASSRLAMALLVAILASCLVGATLLTPDEADRMIFTALWFNGLLVLLVVNVACCFFGRMRGRKLTAVSLGMIMFHLSFVSMLGGIVYNSLFYFRGEIRLTEGETLPSSSRQSYDVAEQGRFFDYAWLKGETTLVKMLTGYRVDGSDKRAAYVIAVGQGRTRKQGTIYITHSLSHNGATYYNDREGYSLLVVLSDSKGRELYGAHIPLQSLRQKETDPYLYTTGTKEGPGALQFPQGSERPRFDLQVIYRPDPGRERAGEAEFVVSPLAAAGALKGEAPVRGQARIGESCRVGDYQLTAREVRYWTAMTVKYEPGKPIVMASLWVGLAGMVLTTVARMARQRKREQP
jgi:cytochrome c biogenesis protein ResB